MINVKDPYTLLALLSMIPGAYLSFKYFFIIDLREQMIDLRNPSGIGTKAVTLVYRFIARVIIGKEKEQIDLFDLTSKINFLLKDKTISLRIFSYFLLTFIFYFLAWLFN